MNRDGYLQSLWQQGMPDFHPRFSRGSDEVYDVLIVGGGITGLTTGLLLQEQGKKCIIAEAANIGFGTSGGTTAHLNTMLDTPYSKIAKDFGPEAAELTANGCREAIDLIEEIVGKYNIDCNFGYHSGYLFAQNEQEAEELDNIRKGAEEAGCVVGWATQTPVPIPFLKACRFDFQAQFHATKYLAAIAAAFEAAGGILLHQCTVQSVTGSDQHTATTTQGDIRAKHLVYATHTPPGLNLLHFRCAPYRSYAAAFRLKGNFYPDGMAYDMEDPYHYYRTQEVEGKSYVIGGGFDHKTGHEADTDGVFTQLEAYLRRHFDIESIYRHWSSQYFESTDGLPYIGHLPGHDNTYVGTGYSGNGMILGTLAGKIFCDMIQGRDNEYQELFRPARIKPVAGFAEFVKENADVRAG